MSVNPSEYFVTFI